MRFFSKAIKESLPQYNKAVLAGMRALKQDKPGVLTAAEKTARFLTDSRDYSAFPDLSELIEHSPDLLYRGTLDFDEIEAIAEQDCFDKKQKSGDRSDYDLVAYVRENMSVNLLSYSPCIETVRPYAIGLPMIPCLGNIIVSTYPKVFTRPQKLLHLNQELFRRYDEVMVNSTPIEEATRYHSIMGMTENNNETTVILRSPDGQDWRPKFSTDVMKTVLLCGPGRLINLFMSSNQSIHVDTWDNPDFKKRALSVEVVLAPDSDLPAMNERAQALACIPEGERLLTMKDAEAIWKHHDYDQNVDETLQLAGVPDVIKEGDEAELVDYVQEKLNLDAKKTPMPGRDS